MSVNYNKRHSIRRYIMYGFKVDKPWAFLITFAVLDLILGLWLGMHKPTAHPYVLLIALWVMAVVFPQMRAYPEKKGDVWAGKEVVEQYEVIGTSKDSGGIISVLVPTELAKKKEEEG
jgi:hypothetical protein